MGVGGLVGMGGGDYSFGNFVIRVFVFAGL